MHIPQAMGGVHLHVRTCARADMPLFRISEMVGRIALKFGVLLEVHSLGVLRRSRVGYICTRARVHVQMCPLFRIPERA